MVEPGHLPQFHVVGFTGHRQVTDPAATAGLLAAALADLKSRAAGEWIGVSSAAAGGDLLFARSVLDRGMNWHAILPLAPADFSRDFSAEDWGGVESLLASAETVTALGSSAIRKEAYLDSGIEVVNACDVLIALWDGEPARGRGGTAEVVTYAHELRKPLVVIDPATGDVRRENFERFEPADPELAFLNSLPDAPEPVAADGGVRGLVERCYRKAAAAAKRSAPQFRRLTAATVLLHVAATIIATAGLAFHWESLLVPWAKLLFVLGALGAALALRHYRAQHNWVRCRLAAEICRAALATWGLPRRVPLFGDLDLPGARQLVRSLHELHRRGAPEKQANLDTFRQQYRAARIEDQLHYYRRGLDRAVPQLRFLRLGFTVSTALAIVCMAAYALHYTLRLPSLSPALEAVAFYFLPIVLPVTAAAFVALVSINDLHRRVARYREMCQMLELAHRQVGVTHTWHSLEQLVRRTEQALLQEVLEWHTLVRHLESH